MTVELKTALRKQMLAKRNTLSEAELAKWSRKIQERLFALSEYKNASVIAFYLPIRNEVDTREMIERAIVDGKKVLVPITNNELEFVEFTSFEELVPGKYGIPEPKIKQDARPETPNLVILPGLAFDLDLHRLGYGKGYYDRALKALPKTIRIGICFDCQIVDKIPRHEHDERLHITITEKRIIRS